MARVSPLAPAMSAREHGCDASNTARATSARLCSRSVAWRAAGGPVRVATLRFTVLTLPTRTDKFSRTT
ncbi:Uncharacterised protein [Mycobacteroides abscessus]|nr:Uncharacterised protein [Mycobacteroides abscessus]